ncbi:U32 family peptidase [Helicobacter saguini]|uniref:U32 family peptidase n=1 Tax=Helicobacter saguini TaxID=1548018 RepID=A0A347VXL8_9HELI|nr:U32 family peptidase [Helicobacter saguini]MWV67750.1 U32 family peptidase [Helicobacter saguini]MWV70782.1 U32 family peptidase [Helicobacter saguini]MWV72686.1 U32 family peptidase [Helicobacter saguini]TLD94512.1 U32 family peptidase [Helicobacter saguini]
MESKKESKTQSKKVQLLSPAGNLEKLKIALDFGADAVYGGVSHFSLRNRSSKDFSLADFQKGIDYAHKKNKKVYVTINGFPFNSQIDSLKNHIALMRDLHPDAFIVAAPGVIKLAKQIAPNVPIHLSTQANVLNVLDAQVFYDMGVKRIVAAREISLNDCIIIKEQIPQLEIEIFVHGSMCFAFSGRCLISALQHGRVPNRGSCANDCRFDYEYYVRNAADDSLVRFYGDEMYVKNPDNGVIMRLEQEQEIGTHIFNAKDLNLASELSAILESNAIDALKIEGRTKSSYYAGLTARTYALALSDFYARRGSRDSLYQYELHTLKHRGFTQGYIVHRPFQRLDTQNTMSAISDGDFQVCAEVDSSGSFGLCKHTLKAGQWAEIIAPLSFYKNSDFGVKFPFVSESFGDSKSDSPLPCGGGLGGWVNGKWENGRWVNSTLDSKKDSIESSLDSNKSLPSKKIKTQILESFIQTSALQNNFLNECQNEIGQIICVENRYYIKLNKIITINQNVIESSILDSKNLDSKENIESNSQDSKNLDSKENIDISHSQSASKDSKDSKPQQNIESNFKDSIKNTDLPNPTQNNLDSKTNKTNNLETTKTLESKTTKTNNLEIIKTKDSITFKNIPYKQLDSIHSGNTSYILLPFTLPPFTFLRIKA